MSNGKTTRKLVVSEWLSLDGVFDSVSMPTWFQPFDSEERQEHIQRTILASDAFLLGRTTYEMLAPYWSKLTNNEMGVADRLNNAPKYVVSSHLQKAEWSHSTIIRTNVEDEIRKLKAQPGRDILIMGSATLVESLAKTDLIDEYRFLIHPIVMGSGKRFFRDTMSTPPLRLAKSETFTSGVVVLCYQRP